jgi:Skp family chaperone for outer membrane proteins
MKKSLVVMSLIGLFLGLLSTAPSAFAVGEKFGYVDIAKVFDEYLKTKEFDKSLEAKGVLKQGEREKMVNEIKKLRDEAELLSATSKETKQAAIDEKIKALQEFDRNTRTALGKERDTMVRDILKEIEIVIQDFGKSQSYSFIFYDRALAYKGDSSNLTTQVIKVLNDSYTTKKK